MKKTGYFFFCFLPVLATLGLQFILTLSLMGVFLMQIGISHIRSGSKINYMDLSGQLYDMIRNPDFSAGISIVYAVCAILLFGFWYVRQFHGDLKCPVQKLRNPLLMSGICLLVPGLQMASSLLTAVSSVLFPKWMDFYEEILESAGLSGDPTLPLLLYAVLLGPIAEELTFRGVILSSAKKALPFWAANLLQAALFGIFHLNVIQGIYALFIGLCLGFVCQMGGSIWLTVVLHILFNAWGTLAPESLLSPPFFPFCAAAGIAGFILFIKQTKEHKNGL